MLRVSTSRNLLSPKHSIFLPLSSKPQFHHPFLTSKPTFSLLRPFTQSQDQPAQPKSKDKTKDKDPPSDVAVLYHPLSNLEAKESLLFLNIHLAETFRKNKYLEYGLGAGTIASCLSIGYISPLAGVCVFPFLGFIFLRIRFDLIWGPRKQVASISLITHRNAKKKKYRFDHPEDEPIVRIVQGFDLKKTSYYNLSAFKKIDFVVKDSSRHIYFETSVKPCEKLDPKDNDVCRLLARKKPVHVECEQGDAFENVKHKNTRYDRNYASGFLYEMLIPKAEHEKMILKKGQFERLLQAKRLQIK